MYQNYTIRLNNLEWRIRYEETISHYRFGVS